MFIKYIMNPRLVILAAVLSLIIAYPVSAVIQPAKEIKQSTVIKVAVKPIIKPTVQPTVSVQPPPPQPAKTLRFSCEKYSDLFSQYNWNVDVAIAICQAESGGEPTSISKTCDRGLMQVNCIHSDLVSGSLDSLYDPATNINVAYQIYRGGGWGAWVTYKTGAYIKYL